MKKHLKWAVVAIALTAVSGCGNSQPAKLTNTSTSSGSAKIVRLTQAKISKEHNQKLSVTSTLNNATNSILQVSRSDFKLKIGAKTYLDPIPSSKLPSQVKANSSKLIRLDFSVGKLPRGKIEPVLVFKPRTGQAASELTQLSYVKIE